MGEANRRAQKTANRTWAKGRLEVSANGVHCFDWVGDRDDAIRLQKQYLAAVSAMGTSARSYADRAVGYLACFGFPRAGDPCLMPSRHGQRWLSVDVERYRLAVLWVALHEHIPNTGNTLTDVFVGKKLKVVFTGDRDRILADTDREMAGQPFSGEEAVQMTVAVAGDYLLNPDQAIGINEAELYRLATGNDHDPRLETSTIWVPRIPRDAAEAHAMLGFLTVFADVDDPVENPKDAIKLFAGYTNEELRRGQTAVIVRQADVI